MKLTSVFILSLICMNLSACKQDMQANPVNESNDTANTDSMKLKVTVGAAIFTATLQNNATVAAFKTKLPMTINMTELNGNEKLFNLSDNLPTNASNPETIQTGDLMLYGDNTLVLFYKSFSTPYSYTKLGRIDDPSGLAAALGSGSVTVTLELE